MVDVVPVIPMDHEESVQATGSRTAANRRRAKKERQRARAAAPLKEIQRFEFAELNIRYDGNMEKIVQMVRRAIDMGYDSVVINVDVGDLSEASRVDDVIEEEPPSKKKKKQKNRPSQQMHVIPDPILVDEKKLDLSSIEAAGKKFRQFSRLTVSLMDSTSVHKLQHHPKRQLYDIVAVRCLDESMLNTMSRKGELFDLITMDCKVLDGHYPWIYKQKLIQACITDGIMFELCYGEALFDNEMRRQFLINGRALSTIANKGRGIILSSGAESTVALRGPYDAANMCTLFGMQSKEGKKLLSDNCCKLLLRSQSRQTIKGAVHITEVENTPVPPHINRNDHLTALAAIPEFYEQMKPSTDDSNSETVKMEVSETD
ncbi:hypothetical protein M3Y94_01278100 [Aphelenchoides besseyi]|nr:hypothetical protein M3Y94_01278100 [Aphelenchoides besseyi]KAI6222716.1 hypothetical protein M3Y95_00923000 [Aphelenchoides besseyi]